MAGCSRVTETSGSATPAIAPTRTRSTRAAPATPAAASVARTCIIRPQQKRAKETKAMLGSLQKGDEVVTAGGIVGRISKLSDTYADVEIAPNVEITVQRSAISLLLPKGTIKSL